MTNNDWEKIKNIEERFELPKEFIPIHKAYGSKMFVCPICFSLLDEVTDNICPSCHRKMAWNKVKDGEQE